MTCTIELPRADQPITHCPVCKKPWASCFCGGRMRTCLIVASEEDWERGPCPMTKTNSCPSDPAKQAQCPEC